MNQGFVGFKIDESDKREDIVEVQKQTMWKTVIKEVESEQEVTPHSKMPLQSPFIQNEEPIILNQNPIINTQN